MSYNPMVDEDVEILENELWSKQYQKVCKVLQEDSVLTNSKPGKGVQKFFFTWPGRSHERSEQICDQTITKCLQNFTTRCWLKRPRPEQCCDGSSLLSLTAIVMEDYQVKMNLLLAVEIAHGKQKASPWVWRRCNGALIKGVLVPCATFVQRLAETF